MANPWNSTGLENLHGESSVTFTPKHWIGKPSSLVLVFKIAMFRAYPSPRNPGPLRAPFSLPGRFSGHIPAKKASLLHTFLKYAVSFVFEANGD
jgi:hypothetical protein